MGFKRHGSQPAWGWTGMGFNRHGVQPAWGSTGLVLYHQNTYYSLPLTISCSSKSRLVLTFLVLPFWYLLTRVDPDIFQTSSKTVVRVCVCVKIRATLPWITLRGHFTVLLKHVTAKEKCSRIRWCHASVRSKSHVFKRLRKNRNDGASLTDDGRRLFQCSRHVWRPQETHGHRASDRPDHQSRKQLRDTNDSNDEFAWRILKSNVQVSKINSILKFLVLREAATKYTYHC